MFLAYEARRGVAQPDCRDHAPSFATQSRIDTISRDRLLRQLKISIVCALSTLTMFPRMTDGNDRISRMQTMLLRWCAQKEELDPWKNLGHG